jgi:hypothetical protein
MRLYWCVVVFYASAPIQFVIQLVGVYSCRIVNQCLELDNASLLLQVGTYQNQGHQHFSLSPAGPAAGTVTINFVGTPAGGPAGGVLTSFATDGTFHLHFYIRTCTIEFQMVLSTLMCRSSMHNECLYWHRSGFSL